MSLRFSRLDRLTIRKLRAAEKITEHGITAERLADGDLRYSIGVMVDGKRVHRVIGRDSEGVTRTQCEKFIDQARTDARWDRLSLPKGRKLALTFAAAGAEYLKRLEQGDGKNIPIKARQLRMYLIPFFGSMRLDGITTFTIEKYKRRRHDAGAAAATINRELATLSHIFSKAVEWRWLDHVPAQPKKLAESSGRIIALTDEECEALVAAAIGSADPDLWLFVVFGLNTAMRHAEILAARWDQLDLARRRLFIPDAKAGEREQPITPELAELLKKSARCGMTAKAGFSRRRIRIAGPGIACAWIGRFGMQSRAPGSIPRQSRPTSCGIPPSPDSSRPVLICRRYSGSAATRRWPWYSAMRMCTAGILMRRSGRSGEPFRDKSRTKRLTRLHGNYTRTKWGQRKRVASRPNLKVV